MQLDAFEPFVEGLDHPEGVAWGPDAMVYAGGEAGQVYRVGLDGAGLTEVGSTGGFLLGICLDGAGAVYACDMTRRAVMRMAPDGAVTTYASGAEGQPFVTPNFPVFDRAGNLYVSDSGEWEQSNGRIWVVRPGGAVEQLDDQASAFPNGLALDAAEEHLYIALSTVPGVARLPLRDGRAAGKLEIVAELPRTVPDGLALDASGGLYVSCYAPDVIYRVDPGGAVETVVEDWRHTVLASPTNIAFAGADHRTLVVASLGRWHLTKATMPVAGQPLSYPDVPAR